MYPVLRRSIAAAFLAAALPALASAQLFSQNQLVTHPGAGAGGADVSAVQTGTVGLFTAGYYADPSLNRYAENFTIGAGSWDITGFRFYAWQVNAPGYNFASWRIWNARPGDAGAVVIAGDITLNSYLSHASTGIYRAPENNLTNSDRLISSIDADASLSLDAGEYWIEWALNGTSNFGGFGIHIPPITELGVASTGDAMSLNVLSGEWTETVDLFAANQPRQGLPFEVLGTQTNTVVPEPSTLVLMMGGLALLALRRRRQTA
jgi:hypothetical protein